VHLDKKESLEVMDFQAFSYIIFNIFTKIKDRFKDLPSFFE